MTRPSCKFDWDGSASLIATPCGILHTYQCQVPPEENRGLLDAATGKEIWHTEKTGQADRSAAPCTHINARFLQKKTGACWMLPPVKKSGILKRLARQTGQLHLAHISMPGSSRRKQGLAGCCHR